MAIEKVINITVNAEGATANVVQLDNAIENTTSSVNDLTQAQKKLQSSSKNLDTQMTKGTVPAMTSFSQVIQDAPFGIRGVANNIQQLTAQMGHLSANAGGMKNAMKSMVGSLVGPAGILLAVSVVTSLLVSFGDIIFNNTKKIEKQTDAYKELNDEIKTNIKRVEKQIELAKLQGLETDKLERKRVLELISRKESVEAQIKLMKVALEADIVAATSLSFWDKWFSRTGESRRLDEEERSKINRAIAKIKELQTELATVNVQIEKALQGEGVELTTPDDPDDRDSVKSIQSRIIRIGESERELAKLKQEIAQEAREQTLSDEEAFALDSQFLAQVDADKKAKIQKDASLKWIELKKKEREIEKAIKKETALYILDSAGALSAALESLAGENAELAKSAGIAGVIIDGTAAIIATWAGYGSQSFVGTAAAIAQSIAITGMMVASIAKIKAVQKPTRGSGYSADTSAPTQPQQPSFNVVGTSDTNQLADTINQQQPVRAFVVANDVTTQAALDRNIVDSASFG